MNLSMHCLCFIGHWILLATQSTHTEIYSFKKLCIILSNYREKPFMSLVFFPQMGKVENIN